MKVKLLTIVSLLLVLILLVTSIGCTKATPTPAPTVAPTAAPTKTATPAPTVTPSATATPAPTVATPAPTAMPTVTKPTIVLKYADPGPATSSRNMSAEACMKEIERLTGGRVKHELYWSESLAKAKDIYMAIKDGTADVGDATIWVYHPARTPITQYMQLLFVVGGDQYAATRAMNEMYATTPEIKKENDDLGVKFLSATSLTPTVIVSKKELRTVGDFKGMRLRSVGPAATWTSSMGATPDPLSFYEVAEALARGMLDGAQVYVYAFAGYKWYEYLKYMCTDGIAHIAVEYWINNDTFNKMPAEIQKIYFDTWFYEYPKILIRISAAEEASWYKDFEKAGVKIYSLTPQELAVWKDKAAPINEDWYKSMTAKGIDGKKIVAKYLDLYKQYEGTFKP